MISSEYSLGLGRGRVSFLLNFVEFTFRVLKLKNYFWLLIGFFNLFVDLRLIMFCCLLGGILSCSQRVLPGCVNCYPLREFRRPKFSDLVARLS